MCNTIQNAGDSWFKHSLFPEKMQMIVYEVVLSSKRCMFIAVGTMYDK